MIQRLLGAVAATEHERSAAMPGDDVVGPADVVMDRAFTVPGSPEEVWPWIAQLGKGRGRWYLVRGIERFLPARGRGLRHLDPRWQHLEVGDVVPDYGRDATFTVVAGDPPLELVHSSVRGGVRLSWAITLTPHRPQEAAPAEADTCTRVRLRLRLRGVRRRWLVRTGGELLDALTVAGMAAGLAERISEARARPGR